MFNIEIRSDESVKITGYVNAVGRDSRAVKTHYGEVVEQIAPGAFARALQRTSNVDMLLDHDLSRKLGSTSEGNVRLIEDSIGLRAEAVINDTEVARKAREGKLRGWSFGFVAFDDELEERAEKLPRRLVKQLDITEVSLIDERYTPVYEGTSVEVRAEGKTEYRAFEDVAEVTDSSPIDYSYYYNRLALELLNDMELRCGAPLTGAEDYHPFDAEGEELRYNPYHDPSNGRFTNGTGGGMGGYLYVGKGQKGKRLICGE